MVIWKRSRRDFRVIKKAVWLVLQEVTEASENSEGEWGEGTSCGKDPASGVQDKCVCVYISRRNLSTVVFSLFWPSCFCRTLKAEKRLTKLDQQPFRLAHDTKIKANNNNNRGYFKVNVTSNWKVKLSILIKSRGLEKLLLKKEWKMLKKTWQTPSLNLELLFRKVGGFARDRF